jgi:hypothetical protein
MIWLLFISMYLNIYLWRKRPIKHIKVFEVQPGVFAHSFKTRKIKDLTVKS